MNQDEANECRLELIKRLDSEGDTDLADQLRKCAELVLLRCLNCGDLHEVETRCKRKWCPACLRVVAARRGARISGAVAAMDWPLFVTFTVPNSRSVESVRELRQSFGKLRNRKTWKEKVVGGVAALEVTNRGNGWHPHLHAVVDCRWLAVTVPAPGTHDTKGQIADKCLWAKKELQQVWGSITNHPEPIIHIKRAHGLTIVQEVLKYSVKGTDLLSAKERVGPLIRVMQMTRLVTTFGNLYGRAKEFDPEPGGGRECKKCGESGCSIPNFLIDLSPTTERKR